MTTNQRLRNVALVADGGPGWIAGVVYVHNLVRALELLTVEERPMVQVLLGLGERAQDHQELRIRPTAVHRFACRPGRSLWLQPRAVAASLSSGVWPRSLSSLARHVQADVLFPALGSLGRDFPRPWMGWISDLQHRVLPHLFSEEERGQRDRRFEVLVKDAPMIVLSSQASRRDFAEHWSVDPTRVSVLPFVTVLEDSWLTGEPDLDGLADLLPDKYVAFPSQWWLHKNHTLLFEALRLLRDRGLEVPVVLTGLEEDYRHPGYAEMLIDRIKSQGLERSVVRLGLLPRRVQVQVMRRAAAVVQPSLFEGWSALVEDARVLGKPMYLSDIDVHREQAPPRAAWFDPAHPEELADRLEEDWPRLMPGPDPEAERAAHSAGVRGARAFARAFLSVAEQAATNWRRRG